MSGPGIEGMVLDKYKILKKLGAGAMGAVFQAQDTYTNEVVALKILAPKLAKDESYLKRFKREVRAARELNHPNIIRVFDAGEYKGFHYFTMEFVEGKSVMELLEEKKRLPLKMALKITYEVAKALDHAHELHIVHRDIKPANIIVDPKKGVKLADMGLAKKVGDGGYTDITMAGKVMGTPFYLAPERISEEGDKIDTRADIYSLGATLYHMIYGMVPFQGDPRNPFKVYHQILHEEVSFPPDPPLPESMKNLIRKMMAKSPSQRHRTPKELLQEIEIIVAELEGRKVSPPSPSKPLKQAKVASASPKESSKEVEKKGSSWFLKFFIFILILLCALGGAIYFADQLGIPLLIHLKERITSFLNQI
ncbi:MAG: serine/threonine protein kinase [Planctomycetota bacterium]|nr:MAG: serine/threonine protein kinase [Planctomycetota bacterium]